MPQQVKVFKILFVIHNDSWDNWMTKFTCTNLVKKFTPVFAFAI